MVYIYLHKWLIFIGFDVYKYTSSHGCYGLRAVAMGINLGSSEVLHHGIEGVVAVAMGGGFHRKGLERFYVVPPMKTNMT